MEIVDQHHGGECSSQTFELNGSKASKPGWHVPLILDRNVYSHYNTLANNQMTLKSFY